MAAVAARVAEVGELADVVDFHLAGALAHLASSGLEPLDGCCCVSGRAGTVGRGLVRCSDGEGQFGERCWDPVVGVEVNGQFVMTAAQVLDERMSCTDHSG